MPRMPHNNRMHTGESLNTHDVWSKTIGYDPYAAKGDAMAEQIHEMQQVRACVRVWLPACVISF